MNGAGESGELIDVTAIRHLSPAGAERRERLDSPQRKGGDRRDSRDEQHAFKNDDEHSSSLRPSSGVRDRASSSWTQSNDG